MSDPFDDLADVLVGAFGANPEQQAVSQWLSTGYLPLNHAISGRYRDGGLPSGRMTEIFGPPSAGKTAIATEVMIAAQKAGGIAAFMDHERSFDVRLGEARGLNIHPGRWIYRKPRTFEDSVETLVTVCHRRLDAGDLSALRYPVIASPKVDGLRSLAMDGKPMSRSMKPIPNRFIQSVFDTWAGVMNGLDGELVVGSLTAKDVFNVTTSAVMAQDGRPEVTYYVFDLWNEPQPYAARLSLLSHRSTILWPQIETFEPGFRIKALPWKVLHSSEELEAYEAEITSQGYEGVMLRAPAGPYKQGRSTLKEGYLLKLKRWEDHEAQVIGFEQKQRNLNEAKLDERGFTKRSSHKDNQVGVDTLGALIVVGVNGPWSGVTFSVGSGLNDAQRQAIWRRRDELHNQIITYTHFPIGAIDKPRFPVFRAFRNPLDMDAKETSI